MRRGAHPPGGLVDRPAGRRREHGRQRFFVDRDVAAHGQRPRVQEGEGGVSGEVRRGSRLGLQVVVVATAVEERRERERRGHPAGARIDVDVLVLAVDRVHEQLLFLRLRGLDAFRAAAHLTAEVVIGEAGLSLRVVPHLGHHPGGLGRGELVGARAGYPTRGPRPRRPPRRGMRSLSRRPRSGYTRTCPPAAVSSATVAGSSRIVSERREDVPLRHCGDRAVGAGPARAPRVVDRRQIGRDHRDAARFGARRCTGRGQELGRAVGGVHLHERGGAAPGRALAVRDREDDRVLRGHLEADVRRRSVGDDVARARDVHDLDSASVGRRCRRRRSRSDPGRTAGPSGR